jgi:hypothetical protein
MRMPRLTPGAIVALGFSTAIALLGLVVMLLREVPTPRERCIRDCAERNLAARMVPIYPPAQTAGMRGGRAAEVRMLVRYAVR